MPADPWDTTGYETDKMMDGCVIIGTLRTVNTASEVYSYAYPSG